MVAQLRQGLSQVAIEGHVEKMSSPRTVSSKKTREELKTSNARLTDDTGSIKLVLWNDQIRQVNEGTRIRFENGYVKEYRGGLQLGIGRWGLIIPLL